MIDFKTNSQTLEQVTAIKFNGKNNKGSMVTNAEVNIVKLKEPGDSYAKIVWARPLGKPIIYRITDSSTIYDEDCGVFRTKISDPGETPLVNPQKLITDQNIQLYYNDEYAIKGGRTSKGNYVKPFESSFLISNHIQIEYYNPRYSYMIYNTQASNSSLTYGVIKVVNHSSDTTLILKNLKVIVPHSTLGEETLVDFSDRELSPNNEFSYVYTDSSGSPTPWPEYSTFKGEIFPYFGNVQYYEGRYYGESTFSIQLEDSSEEGGGEAGDNMSDAFKITMLSDFTNKYFKLFINIPNIDKQYTLVFEQLTAKDQNDDTDSPVIVNPQPIYRWHELQTEGVSKNSYDFLPKDSNGTFTCYMLWDANSNPLVGDMIYTLSYMIAPEGDQPRNYTVSCKFS